MDRRLTNVLIIGITIITVSIVYYFLAFLPENQKNRLAQEVKDKQEKNNQQYLENNIKCREAGDKLHKLETSDSFINIHYGTPEFKFNKNLNTCLYKGEVNKNHVENECIYCDTYFIKDVYTNQVIYLWQRTDGVDEKGNEEDFKKKHSELFGN